MKQSSEHTQDINLPSNNINIKNKCPNIFENISIKVLMVKDLPEKPEKKDLKIWFKNSKFYMKVYQIKHTIELSKIEDENDIIIKTKLESGWGGSFTEIIVYQKDGAVNIYKEYHPILLDSKRKEKCQRIGEKELKKYWDFLNDCIKNKRFEIKESLLNITEKPEKDGIIESCIVDDGEEYSIEIIQGAEFVIYTTYAPVSFIKIKYPGYEERQKLVELIDDIRKL